MWPCTRIAGGESVVMWRSEPLFSTSVCSSSGSVAIRFPDSPISRFPDSLDRFPRHFLDRGDAFHDLVEAAAAKGDHALVDGLAFQFERGGADENQLAH